MSARHLLSPFIEPLPGREEWLAERKAKAIKRKKEIKAIEHQKKKQKRQLEAKAPKPKKAKKKPTRWQFMLAQAKLIRLLQEVKTLEIWLEENKCDIS